MWSSLQLVICLKKLQGSFLFSTIERKMSNRNKRASCVTLRAVVIGLALIPINIYLVVQLESVWTMQYPTTMSIFFNAVFCLFLLAILNFLFRRFLKIRGLLQGELLTIYVMLSIAISGSAVDFTQVQICTLGHAFWFATPENEWKELFFRYIPRWLTVSDEKVLRGYYTGESTFYTAENIKGWLEPIFLWVAFLSVLSFMMLCINVIIRKQWIEREKLQYPLVQLPFEISKGGSFFFHRLLWIGFGIAAGIDIINGLSFLFPVIPKINLVYQVGRYFTEKPLNSIGRFPIQLNPYAIGLAYLVPLDLLFSCWFFYLFWKAENVIGSVLGVSLPGYPYNDTQLLGAYLGIAVVALFMSRKHLWAVVLKVSLIKSEPDDSKEPMKYRTAFLGILFSAIFIMIFSYKAGMSVLVTIAFFVIYFALLFAFTRMRAELGPPLQEINYSGPIQLIGAIVGTRRISAENLSVFSLYYGFTRIIRGNPMPFQLEGFKLAERAEASTSNLWKLMMLSVFVGISLCFIAFLQAAYKFGNLGIWRGQETYSNLQRWLTYPTKTDGVFVGFASFGFIFILMIMALRLRFFWWPLHPVAYPLAGCYYFNNLWFPFFIAWIIKWLLLRFGGIHSYRRALPFFFGLILGEFLIGSLWGIGGLLTSIRTYAFKSW